MRYCKECEKVYCYPLRLKKDEIGDLKEMQRNSCFMAHIQCINIDAAKPKTRRHARKQAVKPVVVWDGEREIVDITEI